MKKPLDTHDVRQAAYRGAGHQSGQTGIPDGQERHDPSRLGGSHRQPVQDGEDRSGRTQPGMGQAGSYGAEAQQTDVTAKNDTRGRRPAAGKE